MTEEPPPVLYKTFSEETLRAGALEWLDEMTINHQETLPKEDYIKNLGMITMITQHLFKSPL